MNRSDEGGDPAGAESWSLILHGTGSGNPSIDRSSSSLTIGPDPSARLLVDCGEGVSRRLLADGIDYDAIEVIVLSHWHADHWTGLPGLLTGMKIAERTTPLELWVPVPSAERLTRIIETSYLFIDSLGFALSINEYDASTTIRWRTVRLNPFATSHLSKHRERALSLNLPASAYGFTFNDGRTSVLLSQDLGSADDLADMLDGVSLLICESTHVAIGDVVAHANLHGVRRVIFTHVGPDDEEKLRQELAGQSGATTSAIDIAYDGLRIIL